MATAIIYSVPIAGSKHHTLRILNESFDISMRKKKITSQWNLYYKMFKSLSRSDRTNEFKYAYLLQLASEKIPISSNTIFRNYIHGFSIILQHGDWQKFRFKTKNHAYISV